MDKKSLGGAGLVLMLLALIIFVVKHFGED